MKPNEDWADVVVAWLDELRALNRSDRTISTRYYQVALFSRTVNVPFSEVTTTMVREYLFSRRSPSTKKGIRAGLSTFFAFCVNRGLVERNPTLEIPRIPTPRPTKKPCPDDAVLIGISSQDKDASLMVELISETGMRRSEVACAASWDLIDDLLGISIQVHGKGNKERAIPLTDSLARKLQELPTGFFFPGRFSGHCHPDHVTNIVHKATGGFSPHSIRHWFATRAYYASGQDILAVRDLLGHESVATTQRYVLGASNTRLRVIVSDVKKYRQGILFTSDPTSAALRKSA